MPAATFLHQIFSSCSSTCHSSPRSIKSEDAEAIAGGCAIPVQAAPTLLSSPTGDVTCVGKQPSSATILLTDALAPSPSLFPTSLDRRFPCLDYFLGNIAKSNSTACPPRHHAPIQEATCDCSRCWLDVRLFGILLGEDLCPRLQNSFEQQ